MLTGYPSAVVKGGSVGAIAGLATGYVGVVAASRRFASIRNLTLPMKAFLVSSTGTFASIIAADHSSRAFDTEHYQSKSFLKDREARLRSEEVSGMTVKDRVFDYVRREKYKIIGLTWVASMVGSWVLVGRNPYLSGQQKLVQARVYAQGLTLAVLCATAAFEIHDQRQGRGIMDAVKAKKAAANHQTKHKEDDMWKDMVEGEEERMKEKELKAQKSKGQ